VNPSSTDSKTKGRATLVSSSHKICTHVLTHFCSQYCKDLFQQQRRIRPDWNDYKDLVEVQNTIRGKSDKMEFIPRDRAFFFKLYHFQVTLSFFPLLHNHIVKAPYVIHVHKRADLGLIRNPFFICIANSFGKNRQNVLCRTMDKKENFFFCV
jgi:hypothetical protein